MCLWKRAKIYFFSVKCWRNLCLRNILTPKVDTFVNRKACKKFPLLYDFLSPVGYICILCKEVVCGNCNLETQTFFFLLWENSFSRDFRHSNLLSWKFFNQNTYQHFYHFAYMWIERSTFWRKSSFWDFPFSNTMEIFGPYF